MILVDTSAWIGHLRGTERRRRRLASLIEVGADLATTEPIVMELLAGADTHRRLEALDTLSNGLPLLTVDVRIDFGQAAGMCQAARRRGHPVRSLVDCLIASVAMRHDVPISTMTGTTSRSPPACRSANTDLDSRQPPPAQQPRGRDRQTQDVPLSVCPCTHPVEVRRA